MWEGKRQQRSAPPQRPRGLASQRHGGSWPRTEGLAVTAEGTGPEVTACTSASGLPGASRGSSTSMLRLSCDSSLPCPPACLLFSSRLYLFPERPLLWAAGSIPKENAHFKAPAVVWGDLCQPQRCQGCFGRPSAECRVLFVERLCRQMLLLE